MDPQSPTVPTNSPQAQTAQKPVYEMESKGNKPILIIVAISILLAVGAGGLYFFTQKNRQPNFVLPRATTIPQSTQGIPQPTTNQEQPSPTTVQVDETAGWKTFSNPANTISLKFPNYYQVNNEYSDYKNSILTLIIKEDMDKGQPPVIDLLAESSELSLDDFISEQKKKATDNWINSEQGKERPDMAPKIISIENVQDNNIEARKVKSEGYTAPNQNYLKFYFKYDNSIYTLVTGDQSRWKDVEGIFSTLMFADN